MKITFALVLLIIAFPVLSAELKVLQYDQSRNLAALESIKADINDYKIGQEINLKFENGNPCSFTITKVFPEKNRIFVSTVKCSSANLLVKDSTLKSSTEDSFPLDGEAKETKLPTINESWYTYWGLGAAWIKYPSDTQAALDTLEAMSADHTSIALDIFGFYWPLPSKQTMMGFVVNGASDSYKVSGVELTVRQYLYGFSTMTFFGPNIGSEWFLRGDVGVAKYEAQVTGSGTSVTGSSKSGFGVLGGGGYAWAIGTETRMLLNLNYAHRNVEHEAVSTTALTLGFLF